ncbi:hypothetical protein [Pseudactinotalea terrae]|uniref:hypothetical protein n=1 Tax=Pseudactinotalea terrae TaxID=1743262 RepID=UPI0012E1BD69|nr:hypothetical protein [Pseudactinotalea terrae]
MNASERRAAYLDDLGGLLRPLTALQRIEVIDGVRDRIDTAVAALGREPSDADMVHILEGIGSVESVAQEALAGRTPVSEQVGQTASSSTPAVSAQAPAAVQRTPRPTTERNFDLSSIPAMEWPDDAAPRPSMTRRWLPFVVLLLIGLGSFFLMFLLPALALIVGAILLWISPLWSRAEKVIGTAVPAIGLGAFLPLVALGASEGGNPMLVMVGFVLVLLGIAAMIFVALRGFRSARAIDVEYPAVAKRKR